MITGFADAHLHTCAPGFEGYADIGGAARLLSCAEPPEWGRLAASGDRRLVRFYGVHPWRCVGYDAHMGRLESILEADPHAHVGEIGLDAARPCAGQREAFEAQLALASRHGRCVSVHAVGAEREALEAVRASGVPSAIMHSFKGPAALAPRFADAGCYMSLSPRTARLGDRRLRELVAAIPPDRLLLETDAPCSGPFAGSMEAVVLRVAQASGADPAELVRLAAANAGRAAP